MYLLVTPYLLFSILMSLTTCDNPTIHIPITRRTGAFPTSHLANLTFLRERLAFAEARFNLTHRALEGNHVVRKARPQGIGGGGEEGMLLMGEVGRLGGWFGSLEVGEPGEQVVDMDLDMLSADWFFFSTTSRKGRGFTDLFSGSFVKSNARPFPNCKLPTDIFRLPTLNKSVPLIFTHCRPSKSSLNTLLPQGSVLGLAPASSLSQTKTDGLLKQLLDKKIIRESVWSIMLINGEKGVFSIGGTGAEYVETVEKETKEDLDRFGEAERQKEDAIKANILSPEPTTSATPEEASSFGSKSMLEAAPDFETTSKTRKRDSAVSTRDHSDWRRTWKWSTVQGADGWWQILMQGFWNDGSKVLKNQPVVLDFTTPFVLAPPHAAKTLYASISGSRPLSPPYDMFHTFPCLNPPKLHFEFAGWGFPAMQGGKGSGVPGGRFSLGRVEEGSGYCVGAVVESRMGEEGGGGGNGLRGKLLYLEKRNKGSEADFSCDFRLVGYWGAVLEGCGWRI